MNVITYRFINIMKNERNSYDILVDVIKLSEKFCSHPIQGELPYATRENFLGRIVVGYSSEAKDICLMAKQAAHLLCDVQKELNKQNLGLFIFDGYRPLRAVHDFADWMMQPVSDEYELVRKQIHYPDLQKKDLSELGFVKNTVSNHCFGSTVDLTLINLKNNELLPMGACFDFFGENSYVTAPPDVIGADAFHNRMILSAAMQKFGFVPYPKEYWHFDHAVRDTIFPIDIEIDATLKGHGV